MYGFPTNLRTPRKAHRKLRNEVSCTPPPWVIDQKVEIEFLNQYWPHLQALTLSQKV